MQVSHSRELDVSNERLAYVPVREFRLKLFVSLVVIAAACSPAPESKPPPMSVVNQSNGVLTEIEADAWCVDGLFADSCAAVDGPVPLIVAECDDLLVVALPGTFSPRPDGALREFPAEDGESWPVETQEGAVLVRADGSGDWSSASWTFELARNVEGC